jgi:hypothetical protein
MIIPFVRILTAASHDLLLYVYILIHEVCNKNQVSLMLARLKFAEFLTRVSNIFFKYRVGQRNGRLYNTVLMQIMFVPEYSV